MSPVLLDVLLLLVCYFVGAIPTGLLVGKWFRGVDIREHGSKNIGATNVWRVFGWKLGLLTFAVDVGRAWALVAFVPGFGGEGLPYLQLLGGLAVLLGNFFNVFLGGKGGKGVATSLGVFLALTPIPMGIGFAVFLGLLGLTRYVSLSSIIVAALMPLLVWYFHNVGPLLVLMTVISALVIFKHRANIQRLIAGTENRIGRKKPAEGEGQPAP